MPPWVAPLIQVVIKYWTEIRQFLKLLTKQPVALAVSATLLIAAVLLSFLYWVRSARYEAVVANTIGSTMESTEQENKGLEAFIFSNVRKHVDDAVRAAPLNPKFIKQYHQFHASSQAVLSHKVANAQSQISLVVPQNSNHQVLSDPDSNYPGFLFLPTFLLHTSLSPAEVGKLTTGTHLVLYSGATPTTPEKDAVKVEDPGLLRAVVLTRALATEIQLLTDLPLISDDANTEATRYLNRHPAQIYIITKEGLNRVFTQGQPHPANEFGNQFPPNTFFPSRPYFWPAVHEQDNGERQKAEPSAGDSIGSFFHVSRPYLDLGGSGVVITLSRDLELDEITTAVLCIDLQFDVSQNLYTALENNVNDLSGIPLEVDCTVPVQGEPDCDGHSKSNRSNSQPLSDAELRLVKKIKDRLGASKEDYARSKVLGTLSRFDESESKASPSRVIFSLPMDRKFQPDGTQKAKLLLVDLDVNEYKQTTTLIALAAATCFGLTTVLLAYLWGSNVMRRREFETSFGRMAEVMYNSPTPYLRLDSEDLITDVSESFCALVGTPPTTEGISELKKKTFRSLLADQASLSEYERVEAARKRREHVPPYVLTLRKNGGATVAVRICSAAVPATEEEKLPQTFGILIELGRPTTLQVDVPEKTITEQGKGKIM
jgi:PAS domain-containing protein